MRSTPRTERGPPEAEWLRRQSLFEHLTATADHAWVAVDDNELVVGYARSILRDGVRELTEFFVLPTVQAAGIGTQLLVGAFPAEGAHHRTIVATLELPALARYLKTGLVAHALLAYLSRAPEVVEVETDLETVAIAGGRGRRGTGSHRRHRSRHPRPSAGSRPSPAVLLGTARACCFGVMGRSSPMATSAMASVRSPPSMLGTCPPSWRPQSPRSRAPGATDVGVFVPLDNGAAIRHLLGRGYRLDRFMATFFSDGHRPRFESYVLTSPPFFV